MVFTLWVKLVEDRWIKSSGTPSNGSEKEKTDPEKKVGCFTLNKPHHFEIFCRLRKCNFY